MSTKLRQLSVFLSVVCIIFIVTIEDYAVPAILNDACRVFSLAPGDHLYLLCLFLDSIGRIIGPICIYYLVSWWHIRAALMVGLMSMHFAYLGLSLALKSMQVIPLLCSRVIARAGMGTKVFIDYTVVSHSTEAQVERNFMFSQLVTCTVLLIQHSILQKLIGSHPLQRPQLEHIFLLFAIAAFLGSGVVFFCYRQGYTDAPLTKTITSFLIQLNKKKVVLLLLLYICHIYVFLSIANNLPLIVQQHHHSDGALTGRLLLNVSAAEILYTVVALRWPEVFCHFRVLGISACMLFMSLCTLVIIPASATVLYITAAVLGGFTMSFYVVCNMQLLKQVGQANFFMLCLLLEMLDGAVGILANIMLACQNLPLDFFPYLVVIILGVLAISVAYNADDTLTSS